MAKLVSSIKVDPLHRFYKIRPMDFVEVLTESDITIYEARLIIDGMAKAVLKKSNGAIRIGRIREYDPHRDRFVCAASKQIDATTWKPYDHGIPGAEVAAAVRFMRTAMGVPVITSIKDLREHGFGVVMKTMGQLAQQIKP